MSSSGYSGDYSYSDYSYSDTLGSDTVARRGQPQPKPKAAGAPPQPPVTARPVVPATRAVVAGGSPAARKPPPPDPGTASYGYSYSDDYSYSDSYYDYSYSETPPSDYYYSYSSSGGTYEVSIDPKRRREPPAKRKTPARPTDSYSYSDDYSYSDSGSYYYDSYSDSKGSYDSYYSYDYSYPDYYYYSDATGGSYDYYSSDKDSSYYDSDSYYCSDSYYYSDSYSDKGKVRPKRAGGGKDEDSYYYSDSYYDDSYYDSDSYYDYSDYSDSYYYDYSSDTLTKGRRRKHSVRVDGASDSLTTSSYGESSDGSSGSARKRSRFDAAGRQRDVLILRTPTRDVPRAPPAPKRCFVPAGSPEDAVHVFLDQLAEQQAAYEERREQAAVVVVAAPVVADQTASAVAVVVPGDAPEGTAIAVPTAEVAGAEAAPVDIATPVDPKKAKKEEARRAKAAEKKREEEEKSAKAEASRSEKERIKAEKATAKKQQEAKAAAEAGSLAVAAPVVFTPAGHYSERSVRLALSVLQLAHLERREVLKSAAFPMPRATLYAVFNTCMTARVRERMAQTFLAHDPHRRGELPVAMAGGILRRLGLACSPVIGGVRVNVGVSDRSTYPEMVMTVEVDRPADAAAGTPQWDATAIPVCRIVRESLETKQPTSLKWHQESIFMGRHCVCRGVRDEAQFQRLKTYIEAATYLCVLSQLYTVVDDGSGGVKGASLLYPHLVRGVLLLSPPSENRKLVYTECLFRSIFGPYSRLAAHFAADKAGRAAFNGRSGVESTLFATMDSEEKRRRNVMPNTLPDHSAFVMSASVGAADSPSARPAGDVEVSFALQKVRIAAAVPAGARCYCLVSAVTADDVFLPAVEIAVVDIRASTKKNEGYTWTFASKRVKKEHSAALFAGPATDRLYIECCYETKESVPVPSDPAGGEQENLPDAPALTEEVTTVWCTGYAMMPLGEAKTSTWPILKGSLLDAGAAPQPPSPAQPQCTSPLGAGEPELKPKSGVFACLGGRCAGKKQRKGEVPVRVAKAVTVATEVKVEVLKPGRPAGPTPNEMPRRFLLLWRHAAVVPVLRSAILMTGRQCSHAAQALRQQFVQRAFHVVSDSVLLDQLASLWRYKLSQMTKEQAADMEHKRREIMLCATTLAALSSLTSAQREQFAEMAVKKTVMQHPFDGKADMTPIAV